MTRLTESPEFPPQKPLDHAEGKGGWQHPENAQTRATKPQPVARHESQGLLSSAGEDGQWLSLWGRRGNLTWLFPMPQLLGWTLGGGQVRPQDTEGIRSLVQVPSLENETSGCKAGTPSATSISCPRPPGRRVHHCPAVLGSRLHILPGARTGHTEVGPLSVPIRTLQGTESMRFTVSPEDSDAHAGVDTVRPGGSPGVLVSSGHSIRIAQMGGGLHIRPFFSPSSEGS